MAHISCSNVTSAVINNDLKKLTELMHKGKRIDVQDNMGNTPLHIAAKKQSRGCINILLQHSECPINIRNFEGCTSLYLACDNKCPSVKQVQDLLDSGANPNIANHEQISPIHLACKNGNLDLIKLLHKYNADILSQDLDNYTPLHFAVDSNQKEVVQYLLKSKADTSLTDCYGLNPLMLAIVRRHEEIFNTILAYTEDLNHSANENETAITLAVKIGNLDIIKKLVERGALVHSHGPESPLGLLNLYEEDKFEIFDYIWSKTESECLSHNINFIFLLVNTLKANAHLQHLKMIFQTPELNLKFALMKIKLIYDKIFSVGEKYPNIEYFEKNKESLIIVIKGLLNQNALMCVKDLETFIHFIKFCPYRVELLNIVLKEVEFLINDDLIFFAFLSHPDLGILLLQHCPYYLNSSEIFNKFTESKKIEYVKYILHFFTPTDAIIRSMLLVVEDDCEKYLLETFTGKVKSLTEISRDATRNYIGQSIHEYNKHIKEFGKIIQQLDCPNSITDILLFKKPVNSFFC